MSDIAGAWSRLGFNLVGRGIEDAEDAMCVAGLDGWDVRKAPLVARLFPGEPVEVAGHFAAVRNRALLGIVGDAYSVVQNEEHAPLIGELRAATGAEFVSGGELDGGRRAFVTMRYPGPPFLPFASTLQILLTVVMSHDGQASSCVKVQPVDDRGTLLGVDLAEQQHTVRIRHTAGALQAPGVDAERALRKIHEWLGMFGTLATEMAGTPMTQAAFDKALVRGFGAPRGAALATVTRTERKLVEMSRLFALSSPGNTKWAAWSAMARWHDTLSPSRGEDREHDRDVRAAFDTGFKTKALGVILDARSD